MKDGKAKGEHISALFMQFHWAGIVCHNVYLANYTV